MRRVAGWLLGSALVAHVGLAGAAEKPDEIVIGITTFSSGPASVFGEPANAAAAMMIEELNEQGGIGGVPVRLIFIDEGAGSEHVVSEYRRVVQDEGADVMLAAISSGNCNQVVPLAEDLKVLNIMWDCGTQRIFEEGDYRYAFRTQANATPEMVATALYLLKTKPDFQTIAVINQDYAWGRDSWDIFSKTLKALKPDVEVVAELFPKFGAPDYSTEITRLSALRPDVVLSTSWGGDLDTMVRQAAQRGLLQQSTFVLPLAESSLQRLGKDLPEGVIVGGRGDHYFLHPEYKDDPEFEAFMQAFREETGAWPIYPVFHMAQALRALEAAYEKAIEAGGGEWPDTEALVDAMEGLEFRGLSRPVKIREDHQGLEDQMLGTTIHVDDYDFAVLDNMMIFPAEEITTPVGQISEEWVQTLSPDLVDMKVDTYQHGS
ncbi:MAG TPA: ABC transporter substrate-binding protein [Geminicoccaceae bacterium]